MTDVQRKIVRLDVDTARLLQETVAMMRARLAPAEVSENTAIKHAIRVAHQAEQQAAEQTA